MSRTKEDAVTPRTGNTYTPSNAYREKARKAIARTAKKCEGAWMHLTLTNASPIIRFPHKIERLGHGVHILHCRETAWDRVWRIYIPADQNGRWTIRQEIPTRTSISDRLGYLA